MLKINNINIQIEEKEILKNIDIEFQKWKNYCLLGQNGSGKSSLALSIMWHPKYKITSWDITIDWKKINDISPDKRAKAWIFLAFQNIPEIQGVKLFEFLRNIYNTATWENLTFLKFKELIVPLMDNIWLHKDFLRRDLNVWFSGGERRKVEILQIKLLKPQYIFLDEIDSWLDIDAFKSIAEMIEELDNENNCFIFITHHFEILQNINIDEVILLKNGEILQKWNKQLVEKIKKEWFKNL